MKNNDSQISAFREAWFDWRNAGKEPTHERAIAIVERELGHTRGLGQTFAKPTKNGVLNDRLSFLVWDLTINGRNALDYSSQVGFVKNLLEQARTIIKGRYARAVIALTGGRKLRLKLPTTLKSAKRGRVRMAESTAQEREDAAERFIEIAKETILRWKTIAGMDWPFVRKVLVRLVRETREAWKQAA